MVSSAPEPPGDLLGDRYQLTRLIGSGGMADVWAATDTKLDRVVAIKVLKSALATDPVVAERFRREAIAVTRLSHPNIVAVYDIVTDNDRQAVVMHLVDGKSLRQLLNSQTVLGPELTVHIGASIASALDHAHQFGFVHRDVKPGNILVTSNGQVVLTDFGIAKGLESNDEDLTSPNVMMGTAKYLSPEQVRGTPLDGRADLYSLGIVLYECLAGRVPFLGQSDADTALARLQRDATDLTLLRPTLPSGLVTLIHQVLSKNPSDRPPSGAALRNALLNLDLTPTPLDQTPPPRPVIAKRPRRSTPPHPAAPIPGQPQLSGVTPGSQRRPHTTPSGSRSAEPQRRSTKPRRTPPSGIDRSTNPTPTHRDRTPTQERAAKKVSSTPAIKTSSRLPIMIATLAAIAAVVIIALVLASRHQSDTRAVSSPSQASAPIVSPAPSGGPPAIASIQAWDPDGDNGTENNDQAQLALADGAPSSAWATECYQNRYLGGKRGVGLIISLTTPGSGSLSFDVLSAPYQVSVYASDATSPPADLDDWMPIGDKAFANTPGRVERGVNGATHLLIWVHELGRDDACPAINPYRGLIGEVAFQP
ncbi:MAG: hypothetical protein CSA55_05630 [Ilumatobacter coccineus]|uniref:non-specific serine/threonine protein kinase n=1 Tax=Ilumatobacter coccineus TaxID=467094 RepID=A0A2G6K752_9ACTN|nr:MAG: hypothetical protein CSA55_05630 [Ilumatobacter coccineus]